MVYKSTIPLASDKLSISQGDLYENFTQLGTIFAVDHAALDDGTVGDRGKHDQAALLHKAADPSTAAGEGTIYTVKDGAVESLRWRKESDGTVYELAGGTGGGVFAFCNFTYNPAGGVQTINKQKNIASITFSAGGIIDIAFTTNASDEYYIVTGGIYHATAGYTSIATSSPMAVGGFRLVMTGAFGVGLTRVMFAVFGE